MQFFKLHGLGNDFIVVQDYLAASDVAFSKLARDICNRHYGVGADGLIFIETERTPDQADFSMRVFNADGSEAEISGNGLRCVGAYLWHSNQSSLPRIRVRTVAGVKELAFLSCKEKSYFFRADMGKPILKPQEIPITVAEDLAQVVNYPLEVGTDRLYITVTSLGNPHCAVFSKNFVKLDLDYVGFAIETHPAFPNRTNVEFVEIVNPTEIKVAFWERGVGRTLSSGTGACSAAVASILNGFTEERVTVHTDGGTLEVEWIGRDHVFLTGSAEVICRGEYFI